LSYIAVIIGYTLNFLLSNFSAVYILEEQKADISISSFLLYQKKRLIYADKSRETCYNVFCIVFQMSNEEAKQVEISKLQKMLEAQNCELDEAKLATINELNKNAILQNQLQLSAKEKSALERELVAMNEVRKENALLKVLR
jgi:methylthioribose-1-phosphate isomerase